MDKFDAKIVFFSYLPWFCITQIFFWWTTRHIALLSKITLNVQILKINFYFDNIILTPGHLIILFFIFNSDNPDLWRNRIQEET